MKKIFLILILFLISVLLCSCKPQKPKQVQPTEEIYQPTRSVATVPVPTKASTCTNVMNFVGDANYEDGTVLAPGTKFTKEWEVINYSDCNWEEGYHLFFVSGNQMGSPRAEAMRASCIFAFCSFRAGSSVSTWEIRLK